MPLFWGDLHCHCDISYGHGSLERALRSAKEHLDFCSVTGHASWPDMPTDRERYGPIIDYHRHGFSHLERNWSRVQELMGFHDDAGRFLTFLSFEWHSLAFGDHNVYLLNRLDGLPTASTLDELQLSLSGAPHLIVPHHLGYGPGARGIDWRHFDEGRSPVVEVFSTHGSSERDGAPYPAYHTMGPRVYEGTVARGLALGKRFGFIAGSDHHAGYPGHYGGGRTAVFAPELTRESIWASLRSRRCYAVTGDRVELDFSLNGAPMGADAAPADTRRLTVQLRGCDAINHIEVVKNNRSLHRSFGPAHVADQPKEGIYKVRIEWGWGEKDEPVMWQGAVVLDSGELLAAEPCFRGTSVLDPRDEHAGHPSGDEPLHAITARSANRVEWRSLTFGNPHPFVAGTSSLILELKVRPETRLHFEINGVHWSHTLAELLEGSRGRSMRGWLSEALLVHRAVPEALFTTHLAVVDEHPEQEVDFYYVRVAQENQQWAWSSPIWVPRVGS